MESNQISHTASKITTTRMISSAQVEQGSSKVEPLPQAIHRKSSIITNSTSRIIKELGETKAQ